MEDTIIEPTSNYNFTNLYLGTPSVISSGVYFTPLFLNDKSVILQTPPCTTKQGIKQSGKKIYTDLIFNTNDILFTNWMENLESAVQVLISQMDWFEKKISQDDLETMFVSCFKLYKAGKKYLFRTNVKQNVPVFDQYMNKGSILKMDDIQADKTTIICILEIQGIRFTSQSFQFEVEVKQIAVVTPDPYLDACFVKIPVKSRQEKSSNELIEKTKNDDVDNAESNTDKNDDPFMLSLDDFDEVKKSLHIDLSKKEPLSNKEKNKQNEIIEQKTQDDEANDVQLNVSFNPDVDIQTIPALKTKASKKIKIQENDESEDMGDALLDFEDVGEKILNNIDDIQEITLDNLEGNENDDDADIGGSITLKPPNQIYQEMYHSALERANVAKQQADLLFLEADEIKQKYGLNMD
jgi:hypothetical protein